VHRAGNSPRRASNFLLLRQKKVTKEEALNRKSPLACDVHRAKTHAHRLSRSDPLRSRCCPYQEFESSTACAVNVGCTPNSRVEKPSAVDGASCGLVHSLESPACSRR
jgi:hypothetical protein